MDSGTGTALVLSGCETLGPAVQDRLAADGWSVESLTLDRSAQVFEAADAVVMVARPLRYDHGIAPVEDGLSELSVVKALGAGLINAVAATTALKLIGAARSSQSPTATSSTLSVAPVGVVYSTTSPGRWPIKAEPSGDLVDITSTPSTRSSIDPSRYCSTASSPS